MASYGSTRVGKRAPVAARGRLFRRRWFLPFAVLAAFATACAPTLADTSVDQVPDVNLNIVELTDGASAPNAPVDAVVNQFIADGHAHGCAVGITEGREIAYLQAYGVREFVPDGGALDFTVATRSAVGSTSKTLTALGAMALVDIGALSLNDELQDVVDLPTGLPIEYRTATLEDLLSHRALVQLDPAWQSGSDVSTPNEVTAQPGGEDEKGAVPRKAVMGLDPEALAAVPAGQYSNLGYLLAGAMIDAVVTEPGFQGYRDDGIEAGYESWVWTVLNDNGDNRHLWSAALNHPWREDGDLEVFASDAPHTTWGYFGWEGPAGGWTMTIGDLARLALAFRDENFVSSDSWDEIKDGRGPTTRTPNYGLGLIRDNRLGRPAFSHAGAIRGYRADVFYVSFEDIGVAVMCSGGTSSVVGLADDVGEAWQTGPGGIAAGLAPKTAVDELRSDGLDELAKLVIDATSDRSRAEAERLLRARAVELPMGEELLKAVDDGNLEAFAECYLATIRATAACGQFDGCPDGFVTTPGELTDALGPCMPGTILPNVHVSCLGGNGRVDTNIVNPLDEAGAYQIEFGSLSARKTTVGADDWGRISLTGRQDGSHKYRVLRDGLVLVDRTVDVACDDTPRTSEPEVTIVNACRAGNGYLLAQLVNPSEKAKPYVIEFDKVPNRSTTAAPFGAGVRAITGRPDGDWNIKVRSGSAVVYEAVVTVDCDR